MKQRFTKLMLGAALCALFLMFSISASAQTTLASWTFDTEYDVAGNVYTPNATAKVASSSAANTSAIWTWNQQILPNTYIGTQSNYSVSGKTSRYWYLKENYYNDGSNYGPFVFQIVNDTEASTISDYTDALQHTNYFEISFPTTNYKNINLSYKVASGSNTADEMTIVCSADGGTTWGVVGTTTTNSNWWVFTSDSKDLAGTANKSNVIVRIFATNGVQTNWNIDDVTITGEYATAFTTEYTLTTSVSPANAGTITRSMNASTYEENTVVSLTASPNIGFAFVEWQDGLGNQLSTANPYNVTMTEDKTVVAVYEIAPIAAGTTITAASWTFDTGYDCAAGIYTPNAEDWAEIDWKWGNTDKLIANSAYCTAANYLASGKTDRAWGVKNNNGDKIFALYTSGGTANSISDYTVESSHNQYVEFVFPTLGLDNIQVSFAYTYSSGTSTVELVYSPDGGTTWIDKGAFASGANWYTYATHDVVINASNCNKVIVRLIEANDLLSELRVNSFTVTGEIATTNVGVTAAKYATYYNSIPVQLPANLQAATIDEETSGTLTLNYRYSAGDVIPGGTAVLLKATAADTYNLTYVANDATAAPAGNLLHGSDVATTTTGGTRYYALQNGGNGLGFYWMNDTGEAFESGAHKAWLALPAASAPSFSLEDMAGGTTGIGATLMNNEKVNSEIYNLAGQRVAQPTKGLYIQNGRKVILK